MVSTSIRRVSLIIVLAIYGSLAPLQARFDPEIDAAARLYVARHVSQWLSDAIIIESVTSQNRLHADLTQADIDEMDRQWQEQSMGGGPLVDTVLGNELSIHLRDIERRANGLITEIFVMDNQGLNVGLSSLTSDYWQADEDKWRKSYLAGPRAVFVDEVDLDESSQRYQTQVSVPVVSPDSGKVIGAVTVGIDAEGLLLQ